MPPNLNDLEWECGFVSQDGEGGWVSFGAEADETCVPFTALEFTSSEIQLC